MPNLLPWLALVAGCAPGWNPHPAGAPRFPLVGLHAPLACVDCHPTDQPLDPACASCHEGARPLDHYAGDCGQCHTPFGWDDVQVDHSFFPLTNAHALACTACHLTPGTFKGLSPACASCHEPDRPVDHFLGEDCGDCHTPTTWGDANFDHSGFFPIPHHGVDACTDCHLVPGDNSQFSCTDCHTHAKSNTDAQHREVGGYRYDSAACLDCHPRGVAGGG